MDVRYDESLVTRCIDKALSTTVINGRAHDSDLRHRENRKNVAKSVDCEIRPISISISCEYFLSAFSILSYRSANSPTQPLLSSAYMVAPLGKSSVIVCRSYPLVVLENSRNKLVKEMLCFAAFALVLVAAVCAAPTTEEPASGGLNLVLLDTSDDSLMQSLQFKSLDQLERDQNTERQQLRYSLGKRVDGE